MTYLISRKALSDLDNIWQYTLLNWSRQQADSYHRLIFKEIEAIAKDISRGRQAPGVKAGYRFSKVKSQISLHFLQGWPR